MTGRDWMSQHPMLSETSRIIWASIGRRSWLPGAIGGKEIFEYWNHPITNAYTECQNMLARAIDRIGRGYSFDTLRVKLLLAPKKTGIITSYRNIHRKKAVADENICLMSFSKGFEDEYETVKVPVREAVTHGVGLAEWLGEQDAG